MNNNKAVRVTFYTVLIFLCGAATGLLSGPMIGRAFMRPLTPEHISRDMLSMLQSRLSLTPEQTEQIKPIMDKTGNDMQAIWLDTTKRVAARVDETNLEISSHLTAEQKPKLEAFVAEGRKRMSERLPFGPPPH